MRAGRGPGATPSACAGTRRHRPGRGARAPVRGHGAAGRSGARGGAVRRGRAAAVSLRIGWKRRRVSTTIGWEAAWGGAEARAGERGAAQVAVVGGAAVTRQPISAAGRGVRIGGAAAAQRGAMRKRCGNGGNRGHRGGSGGTGNRGDRGSGAGGHRWPRAPGLLGTGAGGHGGTGGGWGGPWAPRLSLTLTARGALSEVLAAEAASCLNRAMAALRDIWEEIGIPEEQRLERTDVVKKHIKVRGGAGIPGCGRSPDLLLSRVPAAAGARDPSSSE